MTVGRRTSRGVRVSRPPAIGRAVAVVLGVALVALGCRARDVHERAPLPSPPPAAAATVPAAPVPAATAPPAPVPPATAPPTPEAPPDVTAYEPCRDSEAVALFTSPEAPVPGGPLRVVAVADDALEARLVVVGPDGEEAAATTTRHGAGPYWWYARVQAVPGTYRAAVATGTALAACREFAVPGAAGGPPSGGLWPVTRAWDRTTENLYAVWIEQLFADPERGASSWRALHEVTRQPERNLLYDHLGLGEDGADGLDLEPDCADLPYFLRAYFAWKLGLPFGWSRCSRGGGGRPPACDGWRSNLTAAAGPSRVGAVQRFFARDLVDTVQSGALRVPGDDDRSDLYPIRLAAAALRPGVVYADPYGHTLVVISRRPQGPSSSGLVFAVDAQPDGTVAHKRYWRGNFLFAHDPTLGSPGFKRFRPVAADGTGLRRLTNEEIAARPDYGDVSTEQDRLEVEAFYERVDELLSPERRDPALVLRETIDALEEQVGARVRSVANAEEYLAAHPSPIAMPEGAAIFETTGPWEDYSTPSRDLRLLIAIDGVMDVPAAVARHPERFVLPEGSERGDVRAHLEALLAAELAARSFSYTRSDGSVWPLTLAEVVARQEALETAYDPNDCVEIRWGAPPESAEMETCRRHAPTAQRARMARYRPWFSERRRPPR